MLSEANSQPVPTGQQFLLGKKLIGFLILLIISAQSSIAQTIIHSGKIDSILNLVSVQSISKMDRELSGDTIVTIGGVPQILYSRYYSSPGNVLAAQYIHEKFQSFGLIPKYMVNDTLSVNVYAVKTGSKNPNKIFIIGAHYDDIITPIFPGIYDTIHGADDDASGVCGVLEAARLLANMNLDFTVIFVAFDNEETSALSFGKQSVRRQLLFKG
jgi:acetylornithine deacetylase/succinyl-diaminopimelate desuccinylase-like protein